MIVIDTHVWIWWVNDDPKLKSLARKRIDEELDVRVSAISLLEIVTAVLVKRLNVGPSVREWLAVASSSAQLKIEPITDTLCVESIHLPGKFHRDPADRLIVALARLLDVDLITADGKILAYEHVRTVAAS